MLKTPQTNSLKSVLSIRSYRLLFFGSITSLLGDQFALIATPWLTLQLVNDPLTLGIVLALQGIPRAIFMLMGGAVTDRISPRLVMLTADIVRLCLTVLMALAVFTNSVQLWMLYSFSLGFGLVAGFAVPAENSIVPMIVQDKDLQAGNSLIMSVSQLVGFVGPTVAGIIIGGFFNSLTGVSLALGVDAVSFLVSAVCLLVMQTGRRIVEVKENLWYSIGCGLKYLWKDQGMRLILFILMAINFLLIGPLLVGMPIIANQRLAEGAAAYGLLMSAFAGGNLIGSILAGALPKPTGTLIRMIMISLLVGFSLVVGIFGFIHSTWLDFTLLLFLGLGNGYISILMFTWLQIRTPKGVLGRMMSIVLFFNSGLVPISQAISGAVIKCNLEGLFIVAGTLSLLVTISASFQPGMRVFSDNLAVNFSETQGSPAIGDSFY